MVFACFAWHVCRVDYAGCRHHGKKHIRKPYSWRVQNLKNGDVLHGQVPIRLFVSNTSGKRTDYKLYVDGRPTHADSVYLTDDPAVSVVNLTLDTQQHANASTCVTIADGEGHTEKRTVRFENSIFNFWVSSSACYPSKTELRGSVYVDADLQKAGGGGRSIFFP